MISKEVFFHYAFRLLLFLVYFFMVLNTA